VLDRVFPRLERRDEIAEAIRCVVGVRAAR